MVRKLKINAAIAKRQNRKQDELAEVKEVKKNKLSRTTF